METLKRRVFGSYFGVEDESPVLKAARLKAELAQLELEIISSSTASQSNNNNNNNDMDDEDNTETSMTDGLISQHSNSLHSEDVRSDGIISHVIRMIKSDGGGIDIDDDPEYKNSEESQDTDEAFDQLMKFGEDEEDEYGMSAHFSSSIYIFGCAISIGVVVLMLFLLQQNVDQGSTDDDDKSPWSR